MRQCDTYRDFCYKYGYIDVASSCSFPGSLVRATGKQRTKMQTPISVELGNIYQNTPGLPKAVEIMQESHRSKRREMEERASNSTSKESTQIHLLKKGSSGDEKSIALEPYWTCFGSQKMWNAHESTQKAMFAEDEKKNLLGRNEKRDFAYGNKKGKLT